MDFAVINVFQKKYLEDVNILMKNVRFKSIILYFYIKYLCLFSSVVEQLTRNEQVVGSTPMRGSKEPGVTLLFTLINMFF